MLKTKYIILLMAVIFILVSAGLSHAQQAQLWETGQATCYNSAGTEIPCTGTGQDGDIKAGVAWPSPRLTVGSGVEADCVTDSLTGLMWSKNANFPGTFKTWQQALDYANNLTLCGYSDWRLPDRNELMSLIDRSKYNPALPSGHPFLNVQYSFYWSSTSYAVYPNDAWVVGMGYGTMDVFNRSKYYLYVWPVRSGQFGPLVHSIIGSVIENNIGLGNVTMNLSGDGSDMMLTATEGTYSFTNLPYGSYTITPSLSGYSFTPAFRNVAVAGSDVTGQDFTALKTWFEENDPAITYTGIWSNYACALCNAGGAKISNTTGAKADFSFNGTGIKWIVAKGPMMGKARVYLDGVNMGLVDLYSPTLKYQVILPKTGLTPGNHTLTLEVSGQKNTSSTGYYIDIDAFEVVP